jgi:4a-hydroxytetrahydrobiopterin dehydratase
MAVLSSEEVLTRLRRLPGWELADAAIRKRYTFDAFLDGVRFIDRVAILAEAADHHPDIDIRYTRITLTLSTHSAGGITEKDFALAEQIDKVVKR